MTPAARVQAAIEIVDAWLSGTEGLDRIRTAWGRAHRFAGSGDRAAIADLVYDALRRKRSALWVAGAEQTNARDLLAGSLILDGTDPAEVFNGARHAPEPWQPASNAQPLDDAPRAVRLDYPDWLAPHFDALDDDVPAALRQRAPLGLRVNTLKTNRDAAIDALAEAKISAQPGPLSPTAIRVTDGARRVAQSAPYLDGWVEIQDAASQAVADFAAPRPGDTVLDLCAGGGGKTLAMAAAMRNEGALFATDVSAKRLADLAPRASRAGAKVAGLSWEETDRMHGKADLVLVDAPCSGSGAWRRTPDAKWRLQPDRLMDLAQIQSDLLLKARAFLAPGGRLVYATCSLFQAENSAIVDAFLADNSAWTLAQTRHFTPLDGGDGFFAAELRTH